MSKKTTLRRGKNVNNMNKAELIQALIDSDKMYEQAKTDMLRTYVYYQSYDQELDSRKLGLRRG